MNAIVAPFKTTPTHGLNNLNTTLNHNDIQEFVDAPAGINVVVHRATFNITYG